MQEWHDGRYDRLYVAVVTPYKPNSFEVDEQALRTLLRYFLQPQYIESGIGIIINPEAGEVFYLSRQEKLRNIEIALEETKGKVPVFTGIIDTTTKAICEDAKIAMKMGVDGIFFMPPMGALDITIAWNPIKYPEVWLNILREVVRTANLPIIVHPVANLTPLYGVGLPLEPTLSICNTIPNIVGWKMTYSWDGYKIIARGLKTLRNHVGILCAPGVYFHEAIASGYFDGAVSGSFNYALEHMFQHINAAKSDNLVLAKRIWHSGLSDLHEYIYSDYSRLHVRYKVATWLRGLIPSPVMRPPMPPPKIDEVRTLTSFFQKMGVKIINNAEEKLAELSPIQA
ncbi:MAG: dihydrodipicolinate synthase family protein [Candidatus Caldarchaeum sp.]